MNDNELATLAFVALVALIAVSLLAWMVLSETGGACLPVALL